MAVPQPAAGWYADPVGYQRERYWDGTEWTGRVRTRGAARTGDRAAFGSVVPQRHSQRLPYRYRPVVPGPVLSEPGPGYPTGSFGSGFGSPSGGAAVGATHRPAGYPVGPSRRGYPYAAGAAVADQLSLMPGTLADAVCRELAAGSFLISSTPSSAVLGPRRVPHGLHLLATVITGGLWSVVWIGHAASQARAIRLTMDPTRGVVRERLPSHRSPYAA